MVPFQTIPPSEPFGLKDFFDSLRSPLCSGLLSFLGGFTKSSWNVLCFVKTLPWSCGILYLDQESTKC